jgi:Calcineurin-like phosphoesterase
MIKMQVVIGIRGMAAAVMLFVASLAPLAACAEDWRFTDVDRVVAVSDVHGAYASMLRTLQNAGVLDGEAWDGGATHLVITGDILDRGPDSRKVMDLLMRLEKEALEAGGRVHLLLGNHEIMNLVGDLRYVAAAEYEAFAGEENPADRERAFDIFRAARAAEQDLEALRREFEQRAPPGYFGHRKAFATDGQYGEWLLEKPLIVVINDTAFVHGGLSPMVAELGLDGINRQLRSEVSQYAARFDAVAGAGLIDVTENFHVRGTLLESLPDDTQRPAELQQAIADVISLGNASVHDSASPAWYRGNVGCSPLIENDKLDAALKALGAARVVIGHTPTQSRQVLERLDGRVVEIDTGMLTAAYGGSGHALIIESGSGGNSLSVASEKAGGASAPARHPRFSALEAGSMTAEELERLLREGDLGRPVEDEAGRTIVKLESGSLEMDALFIRSRRKGFVPELAAYRLDRLLGLDMVPVTVEREVDGDAGVLQLFAANAKDEQSRRETGDGYQAWCPLPEQWNAMYIFDTLMHNAPRHPQNIRYSPGNWQLVLTGHDESFGTKTSRPAWLKDAPLQVGDAWKDAVAALDDQVLESELADVLDKRRLNALKQRRDALLKGSL